MATGAPLHRGERLEARLSAEEKELLQRAAALEGTTLTEFVVRSARRAAEQLMQEQEMLTLTARENQALVTALLSPPAPNAALRAAMARYRQAMQVDEHQTDR
jgi:uncharacterized protein (DUF1778 family)